MVDQIRNDPQQSQSSSQAVGPVDCGRHGPARTKINQAPATAAGQAPLNHVLTHMQLNRVDQRLGRRKIDWLHVYAWNRRKDDRRLPLLSQGTPTPPDPGELGGAGAANGVGSSRRPVEADRFLDPGRASALDGFAIMVRSVQRRSDGTIPRSCTTKISEPRHRPPYQAVAQACGLAALAGADPERTGQTSTSSGTDRSLRFRSGQE